MMFLKYYLAGAIALKQANATCLKSDAAVSKHPHGFKWKLVKPRRSRYGFRIYHPCPENELPYFENTKGERVYHEKPEEFAKMQKLHSPRLKSYITAANYNAVCDALAEWNFSGFIQVQNSDGQWKRFADKTGIVKEKLKKRNDQKGWMDNMGPYYPMKIDGKSYRYEEGCVRGAITSYYMTLEKATRNWPLDLVALALLESPMKFIRFGDPEYDARWATNNRTLATYKNLVLGELDREELMSWTIQQRIMMAMGFNTFEANRAIQEIVTPHVIGFFKNTYNETYEYMYRSDIFKVDYCEKSVSMIERTLQAHNKCFPFGGSITERRMPTCGIKEEDVQNYWGDNETLSSSVTEEHYEKNLKKLRKCMDPVLLNRIQNRFPFKSA